MAAKQTRPTISLGTLMLAVLLADFVAFALMIAGVEGFRVVNPGAPIIRALAVDLHYSHSLLIDIALADRYARRYSRFQYLSRRGGACSALGRPRSAPTTIGV